MLKVGTQIIDFPKHTQVEIEGQSEFVVICMADTGKVDDKGKPIYEDRDFISRSTDRYARFHVREDCRLKIATAPKQFLSINGFPIPPDIEDVSPVPVEMPEDKKRGLTMMEKMKIYLADMVAERYGEDSDQYDTFEDAMDFDDEENDVVELSGYEISDVVEEEPNEPSATETPPTGENTSSDGDPSENQGQTAGGETENSESEAPT
jgi:hypothetical protein